MVYKSVDYFSLEQICRSGQCFRMEALGKASEKEGRPETVQGMSGGALGEDRVRYAIQTKERYLEAEQQGRDCIFHCEEAEFEAFWKDYFDLDGDYGSLRERINPRDSFLLQAADFGWGIRILHQDLWEMIVSFLISQQNHIGRIRRCIQNLCEAYGEKRVNFRGEIYHTFPCPEVLADLKEDSLMACNLGYRSKYVVRAARNVVSGEFDLEEVRGMPYGKARKKLLELFGVGEKVADCICLFALHHLEAFPVDTHISQALANHYRRGFPNRRYKDIRGILQQYIFYYELCGKQSFSV
ncbi:MAG: 8-oxoguanine DNA glycosylase [Lachnospiraceae bacterium]|nr:8-oxoguanine DNA glycosylase [Lachnospiraceae bacterium]